MIELFVKRNVGNFLDYVALLVSFGRKRENFQHAAI